ncbi:MAG TPA: hypothetical protein VFN74_01470, partial [Chloroflexota bacterium]|nr:hypothetical protein [Chloroflexota bacterium]
MSLTTHTWGLFEASLEPALHLPGAEQIRHLRAAFESIPWWTLEPDPALIQSQPPDALAMTKAARPPPRRCQRRRT